MYIFIRNMKDFESSHALDLFHTTKHGRERYKERVPMLKKGHGKLVAGFLINEEGELLEHFITSVGIVFIRNHYTRRLVTVTVPKPTQVERYFEQAGMKAPKKLLEEAEDNKRIRKEHEKEERARKQKRRRKVARY